VPNPDLAAGEVRLNNSERRRLNIERLEERLRLKIRRVEPFGEAAVSLRENVMRPGGTESRMMVFLQNRADR
jgi:hypothetical protein